MIKTRIMPTLLYKDFTLVKGIKFDSWRRVGSLLQTIKVFNMREVDELVFLDISATPEGRPPDFKLVDDFADECFMPLAVGGGIRNIKDIRELLSCGADKVVINSVAFLKPGLIKEASRKFGSQCIVISIDAKHPSPGRYEVYINSGRTPTGEDPLTFAKKVEALGAGEILLTSIDRDGTMEGYDIDLIRRIAEAVSIPVIASGGAGNCEHMQEALVKGKAAAIAAGSVFYFTEITPLVIKQFLKDRQISVRL